MKIFSFDRKLGTLQISVLWTPAIFVSYGEWNLGWLLLPAGRHVPQPLTRHTITLPQWIAWRALRRSCVWSLVKKARVIAHKLSISLPSDIRNFQTFFFPFCNKNWRVNILGSRYWKQKLAVYVTRILFFFFLWMPFGFSLFLVYRKIWKFSNKTKCSSFMKNTCCENSSKTYKLFKGDCWRSHLIRVGRTLHS